MGKILLVIVIVIVVGAGTAYAGYRMGDAAGFERANQVRQQFAQQRQTNQVAPGGAATGGAGVLAGGAAGRALGVQGTVKSVEGDTMTVTVANRDVKIKLNDKTQILKSVASTRTDLAAGARVMITPEGGVAAFGGAGSRTGGGADNVIAAEITILPAQ